MIAKFPRQSAPFLEVLAKFKKKKPHKEAFSYLKLSIPNQENTENGKNTT